jgi:hypothetical protein
MTTNTEVSIVSVQEGPLRTALKGAQYLSARAIEARVFPLVEFAPGVTAFQRVRLSYEILDIIFAAFEAHGVNPLIDVDETAYRDTLHLLNRLIPSTWDGSSGDYVGSSGSPYSAQLV